MKILLLTQLFQPEPNHLKGLKFARELMRRGHDVEVLTGFPNYPGGKLYPGYRQSWRLREVLDGVPVVRVPLYPDHSRSGLRRMLCYASLALSACVPGLFLIRKPDVVHVYQGPATLAFPAMLLRLLRGVPYVLDVQDLWPDSVTGSGMLKVPFADVLLRGWCQLTYRLADRIVVLSPGYRSTLIDRGVPAAKIEVVYNWCDEGPSPTGAGGVEEDTFGLSGSFNVVYAGNFGRVQALEAVIAAAGMVRASHPDIRFVFVGDGVEGDRLRQMVVDQRLDNVRFIPRLPVERIGEIYAQSDVLLAHLRDDPLCRIGIPQKTQAYLAAGRPVIMAVSGDAADLVRQANAGLTCEPEDPENLARAVARMYALSPGEREEMSVNARRFYEERLCFTAGVREFESIFAEVSA